MAEVEFIYNGGNINIHCNKNDKMKEIFEKFINKVQIDRNKIYFLYNEEKINKEELKFEELVKNNNINKIKILVNLISDRINKKNITKSNNIIKYAQNIKRMQE